MVYGGLGGDREFCALTPILAALWRGVGEGRGGVWVRGVEEGCMGEGRGAWGGETGGV